MRPKVSACLSAVVFLAFAAAAEVSAADDSTACIACHRREYEEFSRSHHARGGEITRHAFEAKLSRSPENCGKCHMGPDHPHIEIYNESKHGIAFYANWARMALEKAGE